MHPHTEVEALDSHTATKFEALSKLYGELDANSKMAATVKNRAFRARLASELQLSDVCIKSKCPSSTIYPNVTCAKSLRPLWILHERGCGTAGNLCAHFHRTRYGKCMSQTPHTSVGVCPESSAWFRNSRKLASENADTYGWQI